MPTNNLNEKAEIEVYSSVLLEAAANPERAFALSDTLTSMVRTVRSNFELKEALFEEGLPADSRAALVRDIFSEYQSEAVEAFAVMAERGEARLASRVAQALQDAAEEKFTCVFARVTTAVPLDDALREQIKAKLVDEFGGSAYLKEEVDPSIIGGIIINARGRRLDASISSQLIRARSVLSNVSNGGEK